MTQAAARMYGSVCQDPIGAALGLVFHSRNSPQPDAGLQPDVQDLLQTEPGEVALTSPGIETRRWSK